MTFKMGKWITRTASDLGLPDVPVSTPAGARVVGVRDGVLEIETAEARRLNATPPLPRPLLASPTLHKRVARALGVGKFAWWADRLREVGAW